MNSSTEHRYRAAAAALLQDVPPEQRAAIPADPTLGRGQGPELQALILLGDSAERPLIELEELLDDAARRLAIGGRLLLRAPDPEALIRAAPRRPWPGEAVSLRGRARRFRPLRHFIELTRLKNLRLAPPRVLEGDELLLIATREDPSPPQWRQESGDEGLAERSDRKYGPTSDYRRFDRLEEPEILEDLRYASHRMGLKPGARLLSLGCNDGRELALFPEQELLGVDASPTAIDEARRRFPRGRFIAADLGALPELGLPSCDGLLLLNVLQCTTVDRDRLLADAVKLLTPRAPVLVSIPDCTAESYEVRKRPLSRRDPRRDRSLIHKDMRFLTRFFYRAGFRKVECFGALDAFLLALK